MDIGRLFLSAAQHAADFRQRTSERAHHPLRNYADSVAAFSEELPERPLPADDVLQHLVETADPDCI